MLPIPKVTIAECLTSGILNKHSLLLTQGLHLRNVEF